MGLAGGSVMISRHVRLHTSPIARIYSLPFTTSLLQVRLARPFPLSNIHTASLLQSCHRLVSCLDCPYNSVVDSLAAVDAVVEGGEVMSVGERMGPNLLASKDVKDQGVVQVVGMCECQCTGRIRAHYRCSFECLFLACKRKSSKDFGRADTATLVNVNCSVDT